MRRQGQRASQIIFQGRVHWSGRAPDIIDRIARQLEEWPPNRPRMRHELPRPTLLEAKRQSTLSESDQAVVGMLPHARCITARPELETDGVALP
jgi:hypothetical protein